MSIYSISTCASHPTNNYCSLNSLTNCSLTNHNYNNNNNNNNNNIDNNHPDLTQSNLSSNYCNLQTITAKTKYLNSTQTTECENKPSSKPSASFVPLSASESYKPSSTSRAAAVTMYSSVPFFMSNSSNNSYNNFNSNCVYSLNNATSMSSSSSNTCNSNCSSNPPTNTMAMSENAPSQSFFYYDKSNSTNSNLYSQHLHSTPTHSNTNHLLYNNSECRAFGVYDDDDDDGNLFANCPTINRKLAQFNYMNSTSNFSHFHHNNNSDNRKQLVMLKNKKKDQNYTLAGRTQQQSRQFSKYYYQQVGTFLTQYKIRENYKFLQMISVPPLDPAVPKPEGSISVPACGEPLVVPQSFPQSLEAAIHKFANSSSKSTCLSVLDQYGKPINSITYGKFVQ